MKILRVGDPHIKVSNLKDCQKLLDFILSTAIDRNVDCVEFLGDLFHTHALLRVEVLDFWKKNFQAIKDAQLNCRVLVGNHDQPGSKEKEQIMNALNIFKDNVEEDGYRIIVNKPMIIDKVAYIPYMSDSEAFLASSKELYDKGATKLLIAHQTFTGAQYETGFPAPDGIDPALVYQENIISGHIHKEQQMGKCFYPGTPKWDIVSDANEDKGIWIFEHDEDGSVLNKEKIPTKDVVTPIYKFIYQEGLEEPILVEGARNYVELVGKTSWINKVKKKLKNKAQIKAKPTDRKMTRTDSEGLKSFDKFALENFKPMEGVSVEDVVEYIGGLNV